MKARRLLIPLAACGLVAAIAIAASSTARFRKGHRARQLVHRQHLAPRDGEPLQGGVQDAAVQQGGLLLGLQLRQRRRQADPADLEPDLAARRRDRHRRRVADGPERDHQAGLRPRDRRRLVRQRRHGSVRLRRSTPTSSSSARSWRQYLVTQLHGKGNVVMVTGVAGTFADTERNKGVESVIKANPDMKVVARYSGNWDSVDRAARDGRAASVAAAGRRRLGLGRHRWRPEGVHRRRQAAADRGRRGRERLPPVPARGRLQGPPRHRASRSASRRSCRSPRSSSLARSSSTSTRRRTSCCPSRS